MSFTFNLLGFIVVISGLAWIATAMGVSQTYVMAAAGILLVAGVVLVAARGRRPV